MYSNNSLFLESFDVFGDLQDFRFKRFKINAEHGFEFSLASYWNNYAKEITYGKDEILSPEKVVDDFSIQYDNIYMAGARNLPSDWYTEEYEYFAPLYITGKTPEAFFIFRRDNIGIGEETNISFRDNVLPYLKIVKSISLQNGVIGNFLNNNHLSDRWLKCNLNINFDPTELSFLRGIDYEKGGLIEKGFYIGDYLKEERLPFEFYKEITDLFKNKGVITPTILNLSFAFDDKPCTPERYRQFSLNRYYGFYVDETNLLTNLSLASNPLLVDITGYTITIENNYVTDKNGSNLTDLFQDEPEPGEYYDYFTSGNWYKVSKISKGKYYFYSIDNTLPQTTFTSDLDKIRVDIAINNTVNYSELRLIDRNNDIIIPGSVNDYIKDYFFDNIEDPQNNIADRNSYDIILARINNNFYRLNTLTYTENNIVKKGYFLIDDAHIIASNFAITTIKASVENTVSYTNPIDVPAIELYGLVFTEIALLDDYP